MDELVEQVTSVLPDLNAAELREKLHAGGRFVRIKRELTPKQQEEIHELGLPGLGFIDEYRRVYPMGATASHVVGLVDVDKKGLSGIEKFIDDNPQLAMSHPENRGGGRGRHHFARSRRAARAPRGAQRRDRHLPRQGRCRPRGRRAFAARWSALVSLPDFDPNHREQALDKDRLNRIGFGVYEMGSVFKVFTVAGVLDSGLANMRSVYDASSPIHYASFTIDDFHGQERPLTVPEVFIYSSNIGAAKMALQMGVDRHRAFLKKLGLLDRVSTEIGETAAPDRPGALAEAEHHDHRFRPWPLGDAVAACRRDPSRSSMAAIAVQPTFLPRSREEGIANAPRVLKAETSDAMLKLMRLNVLKGTGKRANAEGYRVGGKTGTADKVVGHHYSNSTLLTSFLCTFPTDAPEYLVLVMLDEPQRVAASRYQATAGTNAAPTAGKIIERIGPILGVAPRREDDQRKFDAKVLASY